MLENTIHILNNETEDFTSASVKGFNGECRHRDVFTPPLPYFTDMTTFVGRVPKRSFTRKVYSRDVSLQAFLQNAEPGSVNIYLGNN